MRESIIDIVLATDVTRHFADLAKFRNRFSAGEIKNDEDRQIIAETLMHGADVSNPTRPWELCYRWAMLVTEEFFA